MLSTHKKPDQVLYVFPARRMVKEHDSQQRRSSLSNDESEYDNNVNVAHTNTVNTTITHQHKHPEPSTSRRQKRNVPIASKNQVNGLHKILSNKLNNKTSPNRQQRNVPITSKDEAKGFHKVLSNTFNNKTSPNIQALNVPITNKDQTNGFHKVQSNKFNNKTSPNRQAVNVPITSKIQTNDLHKVLSNTLNNKSPPNEGENFATNEIGPDFICRRQSGHARQPHSSNSPEKTRSMTAGRGKMLILMETYLKMESELRNLRAKEAGSLAPADVCGTVIHNQRTIHNNSHPISSPNGVLRNKRENTRMLGIGRARLAKKSTMAERESPRVSPHRCLLKDLDISIGQFESCNQEKEAVQQLEEGKCLSSDKISASSDNSEIPNENNLTENNPVEKRSISWAEEMRQFDQLHLDDNTTNNNNSNDNDIHDTSPYDPRNSVEKENRFCHNGSPENQVSFETNNYSSSENQNSEYGLNNRHHSKHRINTRWWTISNDSNAGNSNSRQRATSNFVVNGNQISPKDLRHKINSIANNGKITSCGNKRALLTNDNHAERITKTWEESFRSRCSAAGYKFFDTHCHLDRIFDDLKSKSEKQFSNFKEFKEANWATFPKEFAGCLTMFCDPWKFDSKGSLLRSFTSEEDVWIAMGCHPKKVKYFTAERMQQLRECLLQVPSIVAVGEIGLDYSGTFYQHMNDQKRALRDQIRLAVDMDKPIIIHCRNAEEDCLHMFLEECPQNWPIHLHCYTNAYSSAQKWLNAFPNLYIGLTPKVTYKSSTAIHDTAHKISLDRLLLETDSPYFIPSMVPQNVMVTSHPGMAFCVAETVADLKNISVKEVLKACLENTQKLYGIKL